MSDSPTAAAPESGDPELLALLDFEPVPRKLNRRDGWTADLQRRFIRLIVETGTPQRAAVAINKRLSGIEAVYRDDEKGDFRRAWDKAVELGRARQLNEVKAETEARLTGGVAVPAHRRSETPPRPATDINGEPPMVDINGQRPLVDINGQRPLPGQVINEVGEWEDGENYRRRAEEAKDSISSKLLRARRLYLMSISECAVKRAAFEILTELPIDWDRARRLQPQLCEPFEHVSSRKPDILLTAENGWMGDFVQGPDKRKQLVDDLNAWRVEQGLEPLVEEDESTERSEQARSAT